MQLSQAESIATRYMELIRPYTTRIEIAGSVRRRKADVHDIEIVAITTDLVSLDFKLVWGNGAMLTKGGDKFRKYSLQEGIKLDLFLVSSPAQWGVIYLLRTGPAEFSKWCVTRRNKGGALPSHAQVRDGAVWVTLSAPEPMPEEQDFLDFLELGWIEPAEREARWK